MYDHNTGTRFPPTSLHGLTWCLKSIRPKTTMRSPRRTTRLCVVSLALIVNTLVCLMLVSATGADYTVGLLIPMNKAYYDQKGIYYASAINIAMDDINRQENLLPGNNISFIWNDTDCEDESKTIRALMYQIYEAKVSAIIGPGCICNTSARNAAAFNVPMISYVSIHFLFKGLIVFEYLSLFISLPSNFNTTFCYEVLVMTVDVCLLGKLFQAFIHTRYVVFHTALLEH